MNNQWFIFALIALILMGTQRFLYKVSAERNCNTAWTTFSFMGTVSILSSGLFFVLHESVTNLYVLLLLALVNSGSFLTATITHIEALKHIPTSVAYPIIRLNAVVVVLFSLFYFHDHLTIFQGIGIVVAMSVIVILTRDFKGEERSYGNVRIGFVLVFCSMLAGSIASISSKFAAIHTNKMAFIAVSYILSTFCSFALKGKLQTTNAATNHREALIIGVVMGLINFFGYYSFLKALSTGPLSIIASITGMHFVIAVILSVMIYKEKLTGSRMLGIFLTVLSILLLRL